MVTKKNIEQTVQTVAFDPAESSNVSGNVEGKFRQIHQIMIALIVVLALGFITLLVTVAGLAFAYMHDSQDMYKQARDQIEIQNQKIDDLSATLLKKR